MAVAFTAIPDGDVDPESPITTSLMVALRDNPEGIAGAAGGAPQIITGAITNLAVTTAKIAAAAVTAAELANSSVVTDRINGLAVTTGKIAGFAVTAAKIGSLSVETAKIANLAVTNAKLADFNFVTIDIGDWDMDENASPAVTPTIAFDEQKIRMIQVVIRNNDGAQVYDFGADPNPIHVSGANILLTRSGSGFFDNTSFDSTSFNRGWVTIFYVD